MKREVFLKKAHVHHKNKYDYSLVPEVLHYQDTIRIGCPVHGWFNQKLQIHMQGSNCQQCTNEWKRANVYDIKKHTKDQFIEKAQRVHGDLYDYSLSTYEGQMKKITIVCIRRGPFTLIANNHVHGVGCKECHQSKNERFIPYRKKK